MRSGNGKMGGMLRVAALTVLMMGLAAGAPAWAALKMPAFSGETVNGQGKFDSATLQGKVVLVNFWATWCPPCRKEIPSLMKLQDKYRDKGFAVVGVSLDEGGRTMVGTFLEKQGVKYPVILGDSTLAKGFGGVIGVPASFLVDRRGELIRRYDGFVAEDELRGDLEKLLK